MKKLIYEVMIFALVISFTSNSFATIGSTRNIASDNTNDNFFVQNITPEQLTKLLIERASNPDAYRNRPEMNLRLKKNPLSEAISEAIDENARKPVESRVSNSPTSYGEITDTKTGVTLILNKTPSKELVKMSPQQVAKYIDPKEDIIDVEYTVIDPGPRRFTHLHAFVHATKEAFGPYGRHFGVEALTFYTGVGANHLFNLLTKYENNPMALEMFMEELKDPVAQIGFFAFMVGNRYAQTYFNHILEQRGTPFMKARMRPLLGFLAMGVGSMFSNIAHDVITMTKPCASALSSNVKDDPNFQSREQIWSKCQEGWDAVMTSDNLAKYVTSTMTVVLAAVGSAIVQQLYKGVASKALPINSIKLVFQKIMSKKALEAGKVVPGPVGIALKTLDLVIFLQADELIHPSIHYFVENTINSSLKLSSTQAQSHLLMSQLSRNNWEDIVEPTCSKLTPMVRNQTNLCTDGLDSFARLNEKNKKWRETLSYEFMNSYFNWFRYINEFQVMHDVSKQYFEAITDYVDSAQKMKEGVNSFKFNPLVHESLLNGVNISEKVEIINPENFREIEAARATRIVEALPMVKSAIREVSIHLHKWNRENSKGAVTYGNPNRPALTPMTSALLVNLKDIQKNIEMYKSKPSPENYTYLSKAVKTVSNIYGGEMLHARASGPYASVQSDLQLRIKKFRDSENTASVQKIKALRDYIGNAKPLLKQEAFFELFNDMVKATKSEYLKLFDEKGSPADTITWYAVCGYRVKSESDYIDRRRTPVANFLDRSLGKILEGSNAATNWIADTLGVTNRLESEGDVTIMKRISKFFNYGTGVDFYTPRIVLHDLKEVCSKPDTYYAIRPNTTNKNKFTVGGRVYDSLFSYLINNIDPAILKTTNADGFNVLNFNQWWDDVITPKVSLAYSEFHNGYNDLIENKYRKALDIGIARNQTDFSGLKTIIAGPRTQNRNIAKNLVQSYSDELTRYSNILNMVYSAGKQPGQTHAMKQKLKNVEVIIHSLLNDFRNINPKGVNSTIYPEAISSNSPNGRGSMRIVVREGSAPDKPQETSMPAAKKYALLLRELEDIYVALSFDNPLIKKLIIQTTYFDNKETQAVLEVKNSNIDIISPVDKIQARLADSTVSAFYEEFSNIYASEKKPETLIYGLSHENMRVGSEIVNGQEEYTGQLLGSFKGNDHLAVAFITSNQLFAMVEDLYSNISMLNLARIDNTFTQLDAPEERTKGSIRR